MTDLREKSRGKFISPSSLLTCITFGLLVFSHAFLHYQIEKIGRVKWICAFSGKTGNWSDMRGKQKVQVEPEAKDGKMAPHFLGIFLYNMFI